MSAAQGVGCLGGGYMACTLWALQVGTWWAGGDLAKLGKYWHVIKARCDRHALAST